MCPRQPSYSHSAIPCMRPVQARRAVGATGMNERSSRSHVVVTLTLVSTDMDDPDGLLSRSSKLHLIDLAGSERQKDTKSSGERLREGAQINLSLSALGNVINALSEKSGNGLQSLHLDARLERPSSAHVPHEELPQLLPFVPVPCCVARARLTHLVCLTVPSQSSRPTLPERSNLWARKVTSSTGRMAPQVVASSHLRPRRGATSPTATRSSRGCSRTHSAATRAPWSSVTPLPPRSAEKRPSPPSDSLSERRRLKTRWARDAFDPTIPKPLAVLSARLASACASTWPSRRHHSVPLEWQARVNVDPRAVRIADLTREVGELKATLAQRERYIKCLEEHY